MVPDRAHPLSWQTRNESWLFAAHHWEHHTHLVPWLCSKPHVQNTSHCQHCTSSDPIIRARLLFECPRDPLCLGCRILSQNHRMVGLEGTLKPTQPQSLPWAGCPNQLRMPRAHPWSWAPSGMGHPQLWAAVPGHQHPLSKRFHPNT